MNLRRRWAGYWFLAPYLVLFGLFTLGPLLFGLGLSVLHYDLAHDEPARFAGLDNYREAIASPEFAQSLWATVRFVALSVPITVPIALLLAVAVDSARGARQVVYRIGIFAPTVITISVVGLIWRWFYDREFGLFNAMLATPASWAGMAMPVGFLDTPTSAMLAIVAMTLWWTVGGPMLVLLAALKQVPAHYYEAAAIDGATGWQQFWRITLPLLKPTLALVLVLNLIVIGVTEPMLILTGGGPQEASRTVGLYIYQVALQLGDLRLGYAAAMSLVLGLVTALVSLVIFRTLREA